MSTATSWGTGCPLRPTSGGTGPRARSSPVPAAPARSGASGSTRSAARTGNLTDARSPSALGRLARSTRDGARHGWSATDPDVRKRFVFRIVLATLIATAASAGLALLLSGVELDGFLPGDRTLAPRSDGWLSVHDGVWLGAFTSSAMVTPLLVLAAVLWARKGRWERAATAVSAYIASKLILQAGWMTWSRDRPADVAGGEIIPAELASFPSGHAVQTWTVYGLLVLWWAASTDRAWERTLAWMLLIAGSLILGAGRVRIGAHYPSDIAGGLLLGALWLAGAAWAERAVRNRSSATTARPGSLR